MVRMLHERHESRNVYQDLLSRSIRYEADLVDQLFNSSEKRLARILLLLANFGKEAERKRSSNGKSGYVGTNVGTTRSRSVIS